MKQLILLTFLLGCSISLKAQWNFQFEILTAGNQTIHTTPVKTYLNNNLTGFIPMETSFIDLSNSISEGDQFILKNMSNGSYECDQSLKEINQNTNWDIAFGRIEDPNYNNDNIFYINSFILQNNTWSTNGLNVTVPISTVSTTDNFVDYLIAITPRMNCAFFYLSNGVHEVLGNGCSTSRMLYLTIRVRKSNHINLSICPGSTINISQLNIPNGTSILNWTPSDPTVIPPNSSMSYFYDLSNGAHNVLNVSLNNPINELFPNTNYSICENNLPLISNYDITSLHTSKIYVDNILVLDNYTILNSSFFTSDEKFKIPLLGAYDVTFEYFKNGFSGETCAKNYTVTVNPLPTVNIVANPPSICIGNSTTLSATGAVSYTWSPSIGLSSTTGASITSSPTSSMEYTVSGIDVNGCANSKSLTLSVSQVPTINVIANPMTFCLGESSTLTATSNLNGYYFSWSPSVVSSPMTLNSSTVIVTPSVIGQTQYTVTAFNKMGCTVSASIDISSEWCCFAKNDPTFTSTFNKDNAFISSDLVLAGKVYIEPNTIITVDNANLDLTNVDMVFGPGAGIKFINNATISAYNSVFRSCDDTKSWKGFEFDLGSGVISECTFINAQKAVSLLGNSSVKIVSNNFTNNQISVYGLNGEQNKPISGNTFTTDNLAIDYSGAGNTYANSSIYGILSYSKLFNDVISQNNFVSACYNNSKFVYGIYMSSNSSKANVSSNTFTDLTRDIVIENSTLIKIENNEIETTNNFVNSGAPSNFSIRIMLSNSNSLLVKGNSIVAAEAKENYAIYAEKIATSEIKNNTVKDYEYGIMNVYSNSINITDNILENITALGITNHSSAKSYIGCNTINMKKSSKDGFGIFWYEYDKNYRSNGKIKSNCVFDAKRAVQLTSEISDLTSQTFQCSSLPEITNNFLYNYEFLGVSNYGYTGNIGSGLTGITAGRNTFASNNINGGAVDIASAVTPLTAYGNYNVNIITSNVTLSNSNQNIFHSTSSCAGQIEGANLNSSYNEDDFCDALPMIEASGMIINGALTNTFETELAMLSTEEQTNILSSLGTILAKNNASNDLNRINAYVSQSTLNNDQKAWVNYYIYANNNQMTLAESSLASIQSDLDLVKIEQVRLHFPSLDISEEGLNILDAIQNSDSEFAEEARELINCNQGGHPYRIKSTPIWIGEDLEGISIKETGIFLFPNPTENKTTIRITSDNLENSSIIINDISGRTIFSKEIDANFIELEVDFSAYNSGVYFVNLMNGETVLKSTKLIKK